MSAGTLRDAAFNVDEAELEKAYEKGAETVVDLVKQLSLYSSASDSDSNKLMPDGVGLNVNIPAVVDNIEGISYTKLDGTGTFDLFVDELAPNVPSLLFSQGNAIEPSEITVEDSEGQNSLADFITVTPIDGDWTASDNVRQTLSDRIESAPENPSATPLNILLTNDDGFDAPGIETLYTELTAAGHNVTLVGPLEQQSGTGTVLDAPAGVPTEVNPTSEGDQFLSGFITVTPIDGNWTASDSEREITESILSAPEPVLAGDSDDPAIWVNPENSGESIVIGTLKDGGLATFNLQGEVEQVISPEEFGEQRFNNVDIIYNFPLASMMVDADVKVDLAVASDRENDTLAIFEISSNGQLNKLSTPQLDDEEFSIFGVDDGEPVAVDGFPGISKLANPEGEATAYGLATYTSPVSGKSYVFVTQ
ncbi:MAG: phytase, partial [Cyanobacteria bacterium J06643_5]